MSGRHRRTTRRGWRLAVLAVLLAFEVAAAVFGGVLLFRLSVPATMRKCDAYREDS